MGLQLLDEPGPREDGGDEKVELRRPVCCRCRLIEMGSMNRSRARGERTGLLTCPTSLTLTDECSTLGSFGLLGRRFPSFSAFLRRASQLACG